MDMGGEAMKRLIFAAVVFLISVFLISHLYSKAVGEELKSIDKKKDNLVVISKIDLPGGVEITQKYDRDAQIVCYVARGKAAGRGGVTSINCLSITDLSRKGMQFLQQYK